MITIEEAQKAKGILDRFHSRLERLEARVETTEATIEEIKTVIKEKEEVVEGYKKERGTVEYPPRCAVCSKLCVTGGILRVKREDGSEATYCRRCYAEAIKEGKKIKILEEI